jgi:hypothetical protein
MFLAWLAPESYAEGIGLNDYVGSTMRVTTVMFMTLLAGTAHAQEKPATGAPMAPKPAIELDRLKPLEGNWSCKGVTPAGAMGPGSPETKYTSTFTIKRAFSGFSYTIAYDQKESNPPYSGAWNGDALLVQGQGLVPAGFVPAALSGTAGFRDTFTRKTDKSMHWKGELKLHGMDSWTIIGDDDCKKL